MPFSLICLNPILKACAVKSDSIHKFTVDGEPVFAAPWESKVFALAVMLHEQGHFSWTEWSQCLAQTIAKNNRTENYRTTYYEDWLKTLETILADKQIIGTKELIEQLKTEI